MANKEGVNFSCLSRDGWGFSRNWGTTSFCSLYGSFWLLSWQLSTVPSTEAFTRKMVIMKLEVVWQPS
jgi:hypothetical protein